MSHSKFCFNKFWIHASVLGLLLSSLPLPVDARAGAGADAGDNATVAQPGFTPTRITPLSTNSPRPLTVAQAAPEFSDVGRPRRRRGGGSRGSCLVADRPPLTALVPDSSTGYTLTASPSLWFYLPYSLTERHSVEFVLKDSQDNLVHQQTVAGDKTAPGIVNLRLPAAVVLDASQSYEWYLLVQCDVDSAERFVFVNGAIRRLDNPQLQQQIAALSPSNRLQLYTSQNLWYDALDQIASQVQASPQDSEVQQTWRLLLASIGLAELAAEPIAPCCQSE